MPLNSGEFWCPARRTSYGRKREVEEKVPNARAAIVGSITDLERLSGQQPRRSFLPHDTVATRER